MRRHGIEGADFVLNDGGGLVPIDFGFFFRELLCVSDAGLRLRGGVQTACLLQLL